VVEEQPFVAAQGRRGFECRVGRERITLADLGGDRRELLVDAAVDEALRAAHARRAAVALDGGAPAAAIEPELARLALDTLREPPPEDEGAARRRQDRLAAIIVSLLAREPGALAPAEVALAAELLDAAHLSAGSPHRRAIEERVWEQIDAGIDPASIAPLAERLGFSPEAIGAEVIAS